MGLNKHELFDRIYTMPIEELALIMKTALDESNILWEDKPGGIVFNELPSVSQILCD